MQIIQIGSFSFDAVLLVCICAIAAAFGWVIYQDKKNALRDAPAARLEPLFWLVLLGSMLVGRLAFVFEYWTIYQAQPVHIINIRDGGFNWRAALVFYGLAVVGIAVFRRVLLERTLQATGVAAVLIIIGLAWLQPWQANPMQWFEQPELSQLQLLQKPTGSALETSRTPLETRHDWAQYQGRPIVVNLWASWCPPCRREMPVLQAAQQSHPNIHFVFVNQGENRQTVTDFLNEQNLALENVWLDSSGILATSINSRGLPSTLFIDAQGHIKSTRLGELSAASLQALLKEIAH